MPVFSSFSISSSFGLPLLGVVEGGTGKEGSVFLHRVGSKDTTSFLDKLEILCLSDSFQFHFQISSILYFDWNGRWELIIVDSFYLSDISSAMLA